ncbi:Phosphatidylserine decarboxylase proenzyme 2 precursor [Heterostelium album PN500]|uniref:Phosphatidylserine decarboxylase proenzyme 2 n=1 Tax=Heterostelium pallidum (strain ATCC 26659 / Pp 5 / PN500) TaxID=670386 RepID=D3AWK7_HETP5|nr:Phosphatidylserine decarboxylase proenzyme 2 precursor [Heterostelium album PN500]EFA86680.1 Phosphatidylserine decarboxylase proenzyme 2 precursor [Heterostelium album PN500]|eukprot:XP_020438784.1 Phosphatidylserine decarboxylase proenzyme 2 precursor [Heterostelium album PN500]
MLFKFHSSNNNNHSDTQIVESPPPTSSTSTTTNSPLLSTNTTTTTTTTTPGSSGQLSPAINKSPNFSRSPKFYSKRYSSLEMSIDPIVGILQVNVIEAKGLPAMDHNGKSDPYFEIMFSGVKVYKSNIIKKTLSPIWNESYNIIVRQSQVNYSIKFNVWDWDKITANDYIGDVEVDIQHLKNKDDWYTLTKKEKTNRGQIHIACRMIEKKEVNSAFWTSICRHFSNIDDDNLSFVEYTALISTVNPEFPESDIHLLFEKADLNNDGSISVSELEHFFNFTEAGEHLCDQLLSGNPDLIWEAYAVSDSYSTIADNVFNKNLTSLKGEGTGKIKVIYVHNRETGKLEEEKIPHYIEVSLRIMYSTSSGRHACNNNQVKRLLKYLTTKTGKKYSSQESVKEIKPFIQFHNLNTDEILDPLPTFKNFNEFFYRKLKPSARPIFELNNAKSAVSPADCRLHVFPTIDRAKELWIKGKNFNLSSLLQDDVLASQFEGGSLVIARLAPQDYHRFHIPVDGIIGPTKPIDGDYYTVNPIAIKENIDVYTENKRAVTIIQSQCFDTVLFVSVGATMVGSINLTTHEGQTVKKGDEQGYFAFGGSTILLLFKKNTIEFDQDILVNSLKPIETLVKVGTSIGRSLL